MQLYWIVEQKLKAGAHDIRVNRYDAGEMSNER